MAKELSGPDRERCESPRRSSPSAPRVCCAWRRLAASSTFKCWPATTRSARVCRASGWSSRRSPQALSSGRGTNGRSIRGPTGASPRIQRKSGLLASRRSARFRRSPSQAALKHAPSGPVPCAGAGWAPRRTVETRPKATARDATDPVSGSNGWSHPGAECTAAPTSAVPDADLQSFSEGSLVPSVF